MPYDIFYSLSGEKGNTLVSQKRMQRYYIFFIYANFLQKNMHFLPKTPILCYIKVAKTGKRGGKRADIGIGWIGQQNVKNYRHLDDNLQKGTNIAQKICKCQYFFVSLQQIWNIETIHKPKI